MKLARRLAQVTFFAAVVAAGFTVQATHAAQTPMRIVELPRVTVVAKRAPVQGAALPAATVRIVELPRVVIVAKRPAPDTMVVAQR